MSTKSPAKKTKVGVGYIRESTEEQDKGYSPDNQKRTIEDYAQRNGIEIIEWYKDLISGTKASKRDSFQRMVTDAMQKKFEVILVFHTSRFARNVAEARQYKELLRKKQGIDVIFVTQHFGDHDSPSGFLNEGVNELFDEHFSKQLSFWVRSSLMEKRRQGKQIGAPPLGYYKKTLGFDSDRDRPIYAKEWLIHLEEAKLVKQIYTLYATGRYSYADIAVELNKTDAKTKYGHPFTYSSVKDILTNPVYIGMVFSRKRGYPTEKGVHPPIITQELYDKVQEIRLQRTNTTGRRVAQHRFYLLQGLLYCKHCEKHLKGKEHNPQGRMIPKMYCETYQWKDTKGQKHELYRYACKMKRENRSCKQPDVDCGVIDKQVLNFMEGFNIPEDVVDLTIEKLRGLFKQASKSAKDLSIVEKLETKKKKLNFQWVNTEELEEQDYLKQLAEVNAELKKYEGLGLVGNKSKETESQYIKKTEKFLRDFKKMWNKLPPEEKRAWIQLTIKRIWVKDKKIVAIEPHDDFKPLFSAHRKLLVQVRYTTPVLKPLLL